MGGAGNGGTGLSSTWLGGTGGTTTGGGLSNSNFDISNYLPGFGEDYNANDPAGWGKTYTNAAEKERKRQELIDTLQGLSNAFGTSQKQQGAGLQQAQLPRIGGVSGGSQPSPTQMVDVQYDLPLVAEMMGWQADPRGIPILWQIANQDQ